MKLSIPIVTIQLILSIAVAAQDVYLEAECANLGVKWNAYMDTTASENQYVTIEDGLNNHSGSLNDSAWAQINFTADIATAGTYQIYYRGLAPTGADDSHYIRVNGGSWYRCSRRLSTWTWDISHDSDNGGATLNFAFNSGINTIDIAFREDGFLLDKLCISTTGLAPTGMGSTASNCPDFDEDGVFDMSDMDDDNDGIPDHIEASSCSGGSTRYDFFFEDFGQGLRTSTPYTNYCYEDSSASCFGDWRVSDGAYAIIRSARPFAASYGDWTTDGDHTGKTYGRMMVVNASHTAGEFYSRGITGFMRNVQIEGSFWARNNIMPGHNLIRPNITAEFRDQDGNLLASYDTGDLPEDNTWHEFTYTVDPGWATTVYLTLINNAPGGSGNDLCIDDIAMSQYYCDTDGDGRFDHNDPDSDGDGCSDAMEAGHGLTMLADSTIAGAVGVNGLSTSVEDNDSDTTSINFTITDYGNDGIYDFQDADDCRNYGFVLPIQPNTFKGEEILPGTIRLQWRADNTVGIVKFLVYRSTNGSDWEVIGSHLPKGNPAAETEYEFIDRAAVFGINYYLLAEIDERGMEEKSEIVAVKCGSADAINLITNPATKSITISSNQSFEGQIVVFDINGRKVYQAEADHGQLQHQMYFGEIPSGLLLVSLLTPSGQLYWSNKAWIK